MKQIIPSIMGTLQEDIEQRTNKVKDIAKVIQLDILDGKFGPTHSLDFNYKLPEVKCKVEAHLMIEDPIEWIKSKGKTVDTIIFHIEEPNPEEIIASIKQLNKQIGIAIAPETPVESVFSYLDQIDQILIFTAEKIGYYGAKFKSETIRKITEIKNKAPSMKIEVDGSVNSDTIKELSDAGASLFVVGSYIQNSETPKKAINELIKLIEE